ncbi:MAG TPA: hypothetical protein VNO30_16780 [Kofleriaceae bacterium]|nr:hypothetical protein [Kofleriaceae bacterium]
MRRAAIRSLISAAISTAAARPRLGLAALLPLAASCALHANVPPAPAAAAPTTSGAPSTAPCAGPPSGYVGSYRHRRNRLYKSLGSPRFRGVDLIAMEDDSVQTLGGKLAYTAADKDVWDEDVDVYACYPDGWRYIDHARTNREGRFEISLTGSFRLPPGMRDLYVHVPGHGGGVRFLAYVALRGTTAVVSDIDGTLTESEDAIFNTVLFGDDIAHQPHAPRALADVAAGRLIIYVTSRGDQYTEVTRRWLALHGFPRGPLRLARSTITQPGAKTVAFKTGVLRALRIPVAVGIGNRASDVAAYANAGLSPSRIFINLPEFSSELTAELSAGKATAFDDYREVPALLARPAPGDVASAAAAGAAAAPAAPAAAAPAAVAPAGAAQGGAAPAGAAQSGAAQGGAVHSGPAQ